MKFKKFSLEELKRMTANDRAKLYENAKRYREQGGQEVIDFVDNNGLSLSSGDMLNTDPDYLAMEEIIWSPQGKAAALLAVNNGLPALAGVDPLIKTALGERYHPHNAGTINAGVITAALMRHLGYVEDGSKAFPDCIAKSGMKWKHRN